MIITLLWIINRDIHFNHILQLATWKIQRKIIDYTERKVIDYKKAVLLLQPGLILYARLNLFKKMEVYEA